MSALAAAPRLWTPELPRLRLPRLDLRRFDFRNILRPLLFDGQFQPYQPVQFSEGQEALVEGYSVFPVVVGATQSEGNSTSPITVPLPSVTIVAGDLLIVFTRRGGSSSQTLAISGWTSQYQEQVAAASLRWCMLTKTAAGTESGSVSMTSTTTTSQTQHQVIYVIRHWSAFTIEAAATGTSTTPDCPSHSPAGGAANYLWLAPYSGQTSVPSTAPSGYTGTNQATTRIASAWKQASGSSENPPAWGATTSEAWRARTVAIQR